MWATLWFHQISWQRSFSEYSWSNRGIRAAMDSACGAGRPACSVTLRLSKSRTMDQGFVLSATSMQASWSIATAAAGFAGRAALARLDSQGAGPASAAAAGVHSSRPQREIVNAVPLLVDKIVLSFTLEGARFCMWPGASRGIIPTALSCGGLAGYQVF